MQLYIEKQKARRSKKLFGLKKKKRLAMLLAISLSAPSTLFPAVSVYADAEETQEKLEEGITVGKQVYDATKGASKAATQAAGSAEKSGGSALGDFADKFGAAATIYGTVTGGVDTSDPGAVSQAAGDLIDSAQDLGLDVGDLGENAADAASIVGSVFGQKLSDSMTYRSFGNRGKYECTTSTPNPTINEEVSVKCIGIPMGGAAFIVPPVINFHSKPSTGGKRSFYGAGTPWRCHHGCWPTGHVEVQVEYNTYEGDVTMGGDLFFQNQDWSGLFDGSNGDGDDAYSSGGNLVYDPTAQYTGESSGDITDAISDYYKNKSANGGSDPNDGYFDSNGNWHATGSESSHTSFGGYYDSDGNWHSTTSGGSSGGGYYDGNGNWHSYTSDGSSGGYYDADGNWHGGSSSGGGYYDSDGNWHGGGSSGGGYYDADGNWHGGTSGGGYYDADGNWHSSTSGGGYYDGDGNWHDGGAFSGGGSSTSGTGYYDSDGTWHSDGTNPYSGGYYDSDGTWHNGTYPDGSTLGLNDKGNAYDYDSDGFGGDVDSDYRDKGSSYNAGSSDWASSSGGYYDADGNWHDGSDTGSSNLDDYFGGNGSFSGMGNGFDSNFDDISGVGNGFDSNFGMSTDLTGLDAANATMSAIEALANGGYIEDGIIYDADGNSWGSAAAAGLIAFEDGSDQLNNVLAQGGWVDENGLVHDADGRIVGYVVPAGSNGNAEEDSFDEADFLAQSEAIMNEFLAGLGNADGGDGSLMERLSGTDGEGGLLAAIRSTFGLKSSEDIRKDTMTPQQMYDIAAKILKELGYTDADIALGRNYDKDSAYTEPDKAWDMNRITTMQKNFKIDTGIRVPQKAKAMMRAATRYGAVKAPQAPQPKR